MSEYNLSTDYKWLFELLKSGKQIVCYVDYDAQSGRPIRDVCVAQMPPDSRFRLSGRGIEYNGWYYSKPMQFADFEQICQASNVAFIDPDRESVLVAALKTIARGDMYSLKETAMGIADKALKEYRGEQ